MQSKRQTVGALAAGAFAPALYAATQLEDRSVIYGLVISSLVSAAGFFVTLRLIPLLKPVMLRANLFGMDINKRGAPPDTPEQQTLGSQYGAEYQANTAAGTKAGENKVPESMGLACGLVFLVCVIFFQLLHFYDAAAVLDWVGFASPKVFFKSQQMFPFIRQQPANSSKMKHL